MDPEPVAIGKQFAIQASRLGRSRDMRVDVRAMNQEFSMAARTDKRGSLRVMSSREIHDVGHVSVEIVYLHRKGERVLTTCGAEAVVMTDDGTADNGSTDDGTADNGTTDDGTADNGTTDDGTADNGTTDDGTTDDGTADNGTTDDGTTDDGTDSTVICSKGIYISSEEIQALPISGSSECNAACTAAWDRLRYDAVNRPLGSPNISDQNERVGQYAMGKALYFARTGDTDRRLEVLQALQDVIGTEAGARALAVGRELASYVIAADIIQLSAFDPEFDADTFRPWLFRLLDQTDLSGRTLESCQQDRPNNWGTHCGASRAAAAAYLMDHGNATERAKGESQFADVAKVFEGFLGNRNAYAGFKYGLLGWQCDAGSPVGINPAGCVGKDGHNYDGIIPDDQRRTESFSWPPVYTHYSYGNLEGTVLIAEILSRRGYPAWQWSDQAIKRAVDWLWYDGEGKDRWDTCSEPEDETDKRMVLDLVDRGYSTEYIQTSSCYSPSKPSPIGRNIAWTSWTHQPLRGNVCR